MKIKFSIIAIACLFACCLVSVSCGGGLTVDVPVDEISIELNDILVSAPAAAPAKDAAADDALNRFDAEKTVNINDLGGIGSLTDHLSTIQSVSVGNVTVAITDESGEGTIVNNFLLSAKGFTKSVSIAEYNLGTPISGNADMLAFASEFLVKMFVNNLQEVTFTVSGYTDVPSGEKLYITIKMGNLVFKAKALDVIKAL